MTLLLRKGALSRFPVASSRPISSCNTLGALRTGESKLWLKQSTFLSSLVEQCGGKNSFRSISTTLLASKWATGRDALGHEIGPAWARVSNMENPEFYTRDKGFASNSPDDPMIYYRCSPKEQHWMDKILTRFYGCAFFFFFFYNMYWHPDMVFGHHYEPYRDEEFTDEELGIPPDNATDPEYWGHHGEPIGTY